MEGGSRLSGWAVPTLALVAAVAGLIGLRIGEPEPGDGVAAAAPPAPIEVTERRPPPAAVRTAEPVRPFELAHGRGDAPLDVRAVLPPSPYDPLAMARASMSRPRANLEAGVPAMCYTRTDGRFNPCYVCHTSADYPNLRDDAELQLAYAFSEEALDNGWRNLFRDRQRLVRRYSDDEVLAWVRTDNYAPLRRALAARDDYDGYRPDLDLAAGFDEEGFARDGSGWRAVRYKPFPGTFFPTNGSAGDLYIRLPVAFRTDAGGRPSRDVYKVNLSILEAALGSDPRRADGALDREVEPVSEVAAGHDLDGDGAIEASVDRIAALPARYAGGARDIAVERRLYPAGTELLHSVRYLDPDAPGMAATRMKELRYMVKRFTLARDRIFLTYEEEAEEKLEGLLPAYRGDATVGLLNNFGWQLQGFIEDRDGWLRAQTEEEHRFCMGCHSAIGVTADQTFSFARKVPGLAGWRVQDPRGIPDVAEVGHDRPEYLEYFARTGGGDELRANAEILAAFFEDGRPREDSIRRAAPGGDRDITFLILPSRERALELDRAYLANVIEQSYVLGRDAVVRPIENVHPTIENGATGLDENGRVFRDARLFLDWPAAQAAPR
jgi:hypothetical protein